LQTWKEADVAGKRLVVQRVFQTLPCYDRNEGYGTLDLSLPYLVSGMIEADVSRLVDPTGKSPNCADATPFVTQVTADIDWNIFFKLITDWV